MDRLNERIMEAVQKGGRAYLSNATVNGKFALRACITNFRTTKADIDETIAAVRERQRKRTVTRIITRHEAQNLPQTSYDHELRVACELARAAGAAILEHYEGPLQIKQKNYADDTEPVTQADTIANDLIVTGLKRQFPNDGILAEESVDTKRRLEKSRVWMVDPLDGTNGFIDGNGDFAVQIGLAEDGLCVLGVVYQPLPGVLYRAVRGRRNVDRASTVRARTGEGFR